MSRSLELYSSVLPDLSYYSFLVLNPSAFDGGDMYL